jgi:hypothetical protein
MDLGHCRMSRLGGFCSLLLSGRAGSAMTSWSSCSARTSTGAQAIIVAPVSRAQEHIFSLWSLLATLSPLEGELLRTLHERRMGVPGPEGRKGLRGRSRRASEKPASVSRLARRRHEERRRLPGGALLKGADAAFWRVRPDAVGHSAGHTQLLSAFLGQTPGPAGLQAPEHDCKAAQPPSRWAVDRRLQHPPRTSAHHAAPAMDRLRCRRG